MSLDLDSATKLATLFASAITAIKEVISAILPDRDKAEREAMATAITSINAILASLDHLGDATPAQIDKAQADLDRLTKALAGNDAAADKALDDKFDTGDNQ